MIAAALCIITAAAIYWIAYRVGHAAGVLAEKRRHIRELDDLLAAMTGHRARAPREERPS